ADDAIPTGFVARDENVGPRTVQTFPTRRSSDLTGDGVHHVKAIQTDLAGTTSAASAALDITIDTVANAPTGLDLAATDDTFGAETSGTHSGNTANYTSRLTITGSGENGASVTLF